MIRILAFIICMLPFTASASVMTFDDVEPGRRGAYAEDGITATLKSTRSLFTRSRPDLWLVDRGTGFSPSVEFTMGGLFDAVSFDYFGTGFYYQKHPKRGDSIRLTYDNVEITGERNGVVTASTVFEMNAEPTAYNFGNTFENIDLLRITLLTPFLSDPIFSNGSPIPDDADDYRYDCRPECSQFKIDNVTLSAVPLPAALPLFGAALLGLGLLRRFKRR